jgi:hypothetical protein
MGLGAIVGLLEDWGVAQEPVAVSGSKLVPPRHEEVVALRRRA